MNLSRSPSILANWSQRGGGGPTPKDLGPRPPFRTHHPSRPSYPPFPFLSPEGPRTEGGGEGWRTGREENGPRVVRKMAPQPPRHPRPPGLGSRGALEIPAEALGSGGPQRAPISCWPWIWEPVGALRGHEAKGPEPPGTWGPSGGPQGAPGPFPHALFLPPPRGL